MDISIVDLATFRYQVQAGEIEILPMQYYTKPPAEKIYRTDKKAECYFVQARLPQTNKVVGLLLLQVNPYNEKIIWLNYISVSERYKGQGIGKKMAQHMAEFLQDKPWLLERTVSSPEGLTTIRKTIDRLVQEYHLPVTSGRHQSYYLS